MTDNIEYLILDHLKAIRGDLDTIKSDMLFIRESLIRLSRVEVSINLSE